MPQHAEIQGSIFTADSQRLRDTQHAEMAQYLPIQRLWDIQHAENLHSHFQHAVCPQASVVNIEPLNFRHAGCTQSSVLDIEPFRHVVSLCTRTLQASVVNIEPFPHAVCPQASVLDIEPFRHAVRVSLCLCSRYIEPFWHAVSSRRLVHAACGKWLNI